MKTRVASKLDQRIVDELCRAAEALGVDSIEIRAVPLGEFYDVLEQLGADRYVLAIAGTWGDGDAWTEDDDADTLRMLQALNASAQTDSPAQAH